VIILLVAPIILLPLNVKMHNLSLVRLTVLNVVISTHVMFVLKVSPI
jgi:hypothetical protein